MSLNTKYNPTQLRAEVAKFANTTTLFNIGAFATYIDRAEEDIVLPVLSDALYNNILNSTDPTLLRIQRNLEGSVICWGLASYISTGNVQLGSAGAKELVTANEKTPTDSTLKNLKNKLNADASRDFDKALEYIEASTNTIFTAWKASDQYTILHNSIITTAQELSDILGVKLNRRIFLKVKRAIIEQTAKAKATLGTALYTAITAPEADATHSTLRENYLKTGIGKLAFAQMLPALAINFADDEVLALFDNTSAVLSKRDKSITAVDINYFVKYFHEAGEEALDDMNTYIANNPDAFPAYTPTDYGDASRGVKEIGLITRFR